MKRRQLLLAGGACAVLRLPIFGIEPQGDPVPQGGVPSIIEGGIVQFNYPDGTTIRVYDDRLEITTSNKGKPEIKPRDFHVDVQAIAQPGYPADLTLRRWMDALALELRETIRRLTNNNADSNKNYDDYEQQLSLTVYKKVGVRLNCIKKLTGVL